jgi:hypothetical protein
MVADLLSTKIPLKVRNSIWQQLQHDQALNKQQQQQQHNKHEGFGARPAAAPAPQATSADAEMQSLIEKNGRGPSEREHCEQQHLWLSCKRKVLLNDSIRYHKQQHNKHEGFGAPHSTTPGPAAAPAPQATSADAEMQSLISVPPVLADGSTGVTMDLPTLLFGVHAEPNPDLRAEMQTSFGSACKAEFIRLCRAECSCNMSVWLCGFAGAYCAPDSNDSKATKILWLFFMFVVWCLLSGAAFASAICSGAGMAVAYHGRRT